MAMNRKGAVRDKGRAEVAGRHSEDGGFLDGRIGADGADFVLYDRHKGGDWIDADDRWVVCRYVDGNTNTGIVSFATRAHAMDTLRDAVSGDLDLDFGQEDGAPRP